MAASSSAGSESTTGSSRPSWRGQAADAKYDASIKMTKYMEPVLLLEMLHWVQDQEFYDSASVRAARLKLASGLKRPAMCAALHEELHGTPPKEGEYGSLEDIEARYAELKEKYGALLELVDPDTGVLLPSDRAHDLFQEDKFKKDHLIESEGVTAEQISSFFQLSKFVFECGSELEGEMNGYASSAFYLVYFRQLVADDDDEAIPALWGKLLAEILTDSFAYAGEDLEALAELIRRKAFRLESDRVHQRASMLHAALFPCLGRGTDGLATMVQLFLEEKANIHVIRMQCPWLVRYVVFALVTLGKLDEQRFRILALVDDCADRAGAGGDPFLRLAVALARDRDLEAAKAALSECEVVMASDFFLCNVAGALPGGDAAPGGAEGEEVGQEGEIGASGSGANSLADLFLENARKQVYELYCKLHSSVDISMVAKQLRVSEEEAERWIVQLVRGSGLTARIDTRAKEVRMRAAVQSPHARLAQMANSVADQAGAVADSIGDHVVAIRGRKEGAEGAVGAKGYGGAAGGGGGVVASLSRGRSRGRG